MSAEQWADRRKETARAMDALARLPESETKHGSAVAWPFADRKEYQEHFDNKTINRAIRKAPVVRVPIGPGDLHSIQHSVKPKRVAQYIEDPGLRPPGDLHPKAKTPTDHPVVVEYGGKRYLHDGNHRLTAMLLRGKKEADVRLVKLGEEKRSAAA